MEEFEYEVECSMCDSVLELVVLGVDEKPLNCPMCGEETEWIFTGSNE
jgi:Zn finger protein HypA/HybF involved in hydrogenase expression